jgi:two-component system cell cycle sensor histidine kinase/response regulator CckA
LLCREIREGAIHLVITDIVMPEALQPQMKVLFMSGYTDSAIVQHRILDVHTPFLQKPFTPVSLPRRCAKR